MIEKTIFITNVSGLKFVNSKYDRLYYGHEFCEKLIPSLTELRDVLKHCRKHKLEFSLVTPYVTNKGIESLDSLFSWLQNNGLNCEVIINDYGVLDLLHEKYQDFSLALGRLLTKQKRDPRITKMTQASPRKYNYFKTKNKDTLVLKCQLPDSLRSYYQEANINVPFIQTFLRRYQIKRAEIDNLLQGVNLVSPKVYLSVSLYVPYGYITTTRFCSATPFHKINKFSCRISSCKKECRRYIWELRSKYMPTIIYKKGNTLFFKNRDLPLQKELLELGINRLVYQPEIPI